MASCEYCSTPDGWSLALHHLQPCCAERPGTAAAEAYPLVLIHGLASNRFTFDLAPDLSLAKFLAAQGWDVWNVELRGTVRMHGRCALSSFSGIEIGFDSSVSGLFHNSGAGLSKRQPNCCVSQPRWTVDDHLNLDLPAILRHVLQHTGASRVHLIGHSLGGMIITGLLTQACCWKSGFLARKMLALRPYLLLPQMPIPSIASGAAVNGHFR